MSVDENATHQSEKMTHDQEDQDQSPVYLSRFPSPYSRRRSGIIQPLTPIVPQQNEQDLERDGRETRGRSSSRRSSRNVGSPSESGTEADDEAYGLVIKALPAPPFKPRKGVKRRNTGGVEEPSPPMTPTKLTDEILRLSDVGIHEPGPKEFLPDTPDAVPARSKGVRRRRAEILRRVLEGALLASPGMLVLSNQRIWWHMLEFEKLSLFSHMAVLASVYALYPIRLAYYSRRVASSKKPFWRCIRVSAAFDPARYIYPTILPGIVALSLITEDLNPLIPNLVLGIAAIPTHMLGFRYDQSTFIQHWLISLIPVIVSHWSYTQSWSSDLLINSSSIYSAEDMTYLCPLHQTIVPLLHSFTTTSLLPAELQLLSVSLINLLILSSSPHSKILAIILWLGGLGVIILCSPVIHWGVAIARVPRWRLKRAGRIIQVQQGFIKALNDAVKRRVMPKKEREIVESDGDDDYNEPSRKSPVKSPLDLPTLKTEVINALKQNFFPADEDGTKSAVERSTASLKDRWPSTPPRSDRRRRHTVSNKPVEISHGPATTPRRKRGRALTNSYFLNLTPEQATVRKWSYAAYIYVVIAGLVLGPIRSLVSKLALEGAEPFGWAIGYLGGNIRDLRFWIVSSDLDWWIPLPPMISGEGLDTTTLGRASYVRDILVGPANMRLVICAYCLAIIAAGMITVLGLVTSVEVDTRRKVFHGMMVAMLLPTIYIDPTFTSLALVIILAIFIILDLLRASQLPPLSKPLAYFLTPYVDGRDLRGPVVISHIFLLIGCAVPLWLSLAGTKLMGEHPWPQWEATTRDVSMISGVTCVGMGDAAASLIGRRYGRHKWPWSGGKSLEGSIAFSFAVTAGLLFGKAWLQFGQWTDLNESTSWTTLVGKAGIASAAASLMEAVLTGGNDNVVVPVVLWVFVRALRI